MHSLQIIIPILNEENTLPKLLMLLKPLSVPYVFVDGGSTDTTLTLLHAANVVVLSSQAGRAKQMNWGAQHVVADTLIFLHADTLLEEKHVMAMQQAMLCPTCLGGRFDVRLSGSHPLLRVVEWMINVRSRYTGIATGDQVMFVRKRVFHELGGFPDIPIMEDVAFSRLLKKQGDIAYLKEKVTTSSRRWEERGIMSTVFLMWRLRFLFFLGVSAEKLQHAYRDQR